MINASLYPKLPYDTVKDFAPITIAATTPNVLIVHPSVPARTVRRAGRPDPREEIRQLCHGRRRHALARLRRAFKLALKLDLTAIPFNGGGPAIASVIAGHTPISFSALAPAAPGIKAGLLRALAVTSNTRSSVLPDVPTLAEAGFPDQENDTPQGVLAPAGTPRPIIDLLNREVARVMASPDVKQRMLAIGFEPVVTTPEEFAERIRTDIPRLGRIVREAHIRPE